MSALGQGLLLLVSLIAHRFRCDNNVLSHGNTVPSTSPHIRSRAQGIYCLDLSSNEAYTPSASPAGDIVLRSRGRALLVRTRKTFLGYPVRLLGVGNCLPYMIGKALTYGTYVALG